MKLSIKFNFNLLSGFGEKNMYLGITITNPNGLFKALPL